MVEIELIKVWDTWVRIGHWALVLSIALAWLSGDGSGRIHEWLGYLTLAIVGLRIIWGVVGSPYARFSQFVRGPQATVGYFKQVLAHREQRHLGHNPLGAWMIVALLLAVALTGITGWLYTTEQFWGNDRVEEIHEFFSQSILVLAAIHISGVIFSSLRHRENLVKAMFTGMKRK